MIDGYRFGHIVINRIPYNKDVIVFPDSVQDHWWRRDGHRLVLEDIQEALNKLKPEILIVGLGQMGIMKIDPSLIQFLKKEGITLHAEKTGKAVKIYNRLILLNDKVLGAFHLTC